MANRVAFACDCGGISGHVENPVSKGVHLVCFCAFCRAGAAFCGDAPPEGQPVDLYITQPTQITLDKGAERLRPFAFSSKGVVRWKAACCDVQMFSSQPNPKVAFMSVRTARLADSAAVGPVRTRAFVPKGNGKAGQEGIAGLAKLVFGSLGARLSGKWRNSPLYDDEMNPIHPVRMLSRDEKKALLGASA